MRWPMRRSLWKWAACVTCGVLARAALAADAPAAPSAPAPALGQPAAATGTPDEVLKTKGLIKFASAYVLDVDAKLADRLRTLRAAQRLIDENARKRAAMQREIEQHEALIARGDAEFRDLNKRLLDTRDASQKNKIGAKANIVGTQLRDLQRSVDALQKA